MLPKNNFSTNGLALSDPSTRIANAIRRLAEARESLERAAFELEALTGGAVLVRLEFEVDGVAESAAPFEVGAEPFPREP